VFWGDDMACAFRAGDSGIAHADVYVRDEFRATATTPEALRDALYRLAAERKAKS